MIGLESWRPMLMFTNEIMKLILTLLLTLQEGSAIDIFMGW